MNVQTRSSSKHITFAAHAPHAISAESTARSTQISARARIASRSGAGVGVGAASTTPKRSFDGGSHSSSQLKVLVDHAERRHCIGCRLRSRPGQGSRSNAFWSWSCRLDGGMDTVPVHAAVKSVAVRTTGAASARAPDRSEIARREHARKVPV